jgi:hypothetical protein
VGRWLARGCIAFVYPHYVAKVERRPILRPARLSRPDPSRSAERSMSLGVSDERLNHQRLPSIGVSAIVRLFNTLTREVGDFVPRDPPRVSMYSCGPTVYPSPTSSTAKMVRSSKPTSSSHMRVASEVIRGSGSSNGVSQPEGCRGP